MSAVDDGDIVLGRFRCPRCGTDVLEAVFDGDDTNFVCHSCWSCWHVELGYVAAVPPRACTGCRYRDRCLAADVARGAGLANESVAPQS